MRYSKREIAESWSLWADVTKAENREGFDALSVEERMAILDELSDEVSRTAYVLLNGRHILKVWTHEGVRYVDMLESHAKNTPRVLVEREVMKYQRRVEGPLFDTIGEALAFVGSNGSLHTSTSMLQQLERAAAAHDEPEPFIERRTVKTRQLIQYAQLITSVGNAIIAMLGVALVVAFASEVYEIAERTIEILLEQLR